MSGWVMTVLAFLLLLGFAKLLERATERPGDDERIVPNRPA